MFDVNISTMETITDLTLVLTNPNSEYYVYYWGIPFKVFFVMYLIVLFVVGLFGNLVALLGSIYRHAIKSDKISVVMLQDLAITDILLSIFMYIPLLTTAIANRWVLGKVFCGFSHYLYEVLLLNKIVVIALFSIYRLWLLNKPPSIKRFLNQTYCVVVCVVVPFLCFIPQIAMDLFIEEASTFFDPRRLNCYGMNYYQNGAIVSLAILSPFLILPIGIILLANIRLIYVLVQQARKSRRGFQKRRLFIAIKIIRLLIVVTYMPAVISMLMEGIYGSDKEAHTTMFQNLTLLNMIVPLNCAASPILYALSNRKFRAYLMNCGGLLEKRKPSWYSTTTRQSVPTGLNSEIGTCGESKV